MIPFVECPFLLLTADMSFTCLYCSTLQKMSAALQAGSSTSQINLDVDAYEPLFDAVYESGESDLDDVDDLDSEDGSDEDYDEDEKDAEDDNDDNDDNDDDDADDDECDDDDCDDDELMEYDKQEGAGDLPLIPGEDDYKRLDSHRGIPSDGKPLIRSAEKSIMKPCMWPNYPLLLKVLIVYCTTKRAPSLHIRITAFTDLKWCHNSLLLSPYNLLKISLTIF